MNSNTSPKKIKHGAQRKQETIFICIIFQKKRFRQWYVIQFPQTDSDFVRYHLAQASTAQCKDDQESFESSEADLASAVVGLESAISKVTATKAVVGSRDGLGEVDWKTSMSVGCC